MKAVRKLVLLLGAGLLPVLDARASALEDAYLESCRKDPGVPVPITVVSPTVGAEHNGGLVQLEFLVDAQGKPAEFSVKFASDDALAKLVVAAVKQWRFQPGEIDGKPVPTRVGLPVRIIESTVGVERFAARE